MQCGICLGWLVKLAILANKLTLAAALFAFASVHCAANYLVSLWISKSVHFMCGCRWRHIMNSLESHFNEISQPLHHKFMNDLNSKCTSATAEHEFHLSEEKASRTMITQLRVSVKHFFVYFTKHSPRQAQGWHNPFEKSTLNPPKSGRDWNCTLGLDKLKGVKIEASRAWKS